MRLPVSFLSQTSPKAEGKSTWSAPLSTLIGSGVLGNVHPPFPLAGAGALSFFFTAQIWKHLASSVRGIGLQGLFSQVLPICEGSAPLPLRFRRTNNFRELEDWSVPQTHRGLTLLSGQRCCIQRKTSRAINWMISFTWASPIWNVILLSRRRVSVSPGPNVGPKAIDPVKGDSEIEQVGKWHTHTHRDIYINTYIGSRFPCGLLGLLKCNQVICTYSFTGSFPILMPFSNCWFKFKISYNCQLPGSPELIKLEGGADQVHFPSA